MEKKWMCGLKVLFILICCICMTGCYKDIRDYCEAEAACEGGNDNDEKACVEYMKGRRKAAQEYDCKDKFDDLIECEVDNGSCVDEGDGYSYYTAAGDCDDQAESYYECLDNASAWDD